MASGGMDIEHIIVVNDPAHHGAPPVPLQSLKDGLRLLAVRPQSYDEGIDDFDLRIVDAGILRRQMNRGALALCDPVRLLEDDRVYEQTIDAPAPFAGSVFLLTAAGLVAALFPGAHLAWAGQRRGLLGPTHPEPRPGITAAKVLTPEQLARREAEERARRTEIARQRAEMRRNQSLLETYSSVADIESRRDRAVEGVEQELRQAEARYAESMKKRSGLMREAEFYQKRAMPPALAAALRDSDSELAAQKSIIEAKRRDIEAIRARFEQNRQRYMALTEPRPLPR